MACDKCILTSRMSETRTPAIPPNISPHLIPKDGLSILDFLEYPLPPIMQTAQPDLCPQSLLSKMPPTTTSTATIQSIPVPPLSVIEVLVHSKELTSANSIICYHSPASGFRNVRLPTWS